MQSEQSHNLQIYGYLNIRALYCFKICPIYSAYLSKASFAEVAQSKGLGIFNESATLNLLQPQEFFGAMLEYKLTNPLIPLQEAPL